MTGGAHEGGGGGKLPRAPRAWGTGRRASTPRGGGEEELGRAPGGPQEGGRGEGGKLGRTRKPT
jgi:hypothetical protein